MLADVLTCALVGIDASLVHVEVDIAAGIPQTATIGLPDHVVRESKDRVRSALRNSGFEIPPRRITVNLAPAYFRKEGAGYDLPIALAILAATGHDVSTHVTGVIIAGELALDGTVRRYAACCRSRSRRQPRSVRACSCPRQTPPRRVSSRACRSLA